MRIYRGTYKIVAMIIIPFTVLFSLQISAQDSINMHYTFSQTNSNYSFYGSFKLIALPECLLEISFNHEHIKALALDAKEVELISQGKNWNQIRYTYQEFPFYKNVSLWQRVYNQENRRVDFTLITSKNSHSLMPRMISSSGYYKITQQGEYVIMEYFQQCQLTEEYITKLYLNRAKKKAKEFLYLFSDYARSYCGNAQSKKIH